VPAGVLVLLLGALLWAPWRALHGAPLAELSGDQDFQLFLHKNLEFTRKIKGDVAALQRVVVSPGHRGGGTVATGAAGRDTGLCIPGLAPAPQAPPGCCRAPGGLCGSRADASVSARLQMEDLGLATVTVTYPTESREPLPAFSRFHHQVSGFFILANFQRFLETAYRALRHLARL
ncbi:MGF factor, partial [Chunga burmeisteri]|nr:MGF factor [Chunga burmeisteri]